MDIKKKSTPSIGDVFNSYLKELRITEFPCNSGKWRNNLRWDSDLLEYENDIFADLYTVEKLLELSKQKPFIRDIEWSSDAKQLLRDAIEYPDKIKSEIIQQKIKCLKMIDKNIEKVDEYISKFENLEELILSGNKIKSIDTKILPRSLKILELCGNNLNEDIGSICKSPPREIQHIGLSYNNITNLSKFTQLPNRWNSLLSLDLSYNNIQDLFKLVDTLQKLPKIRNLLLFGNPLCLFPGYRGFIINSFQSLKFLDEVNISANEKHLFKGMIRLKSLLPTSDFNLVDLRLDNFKGRARNVENEIDEVIRTFIKYHFEFNFMNDCTVIDAGDLYSDAQDGENIPIIPECCDNDGKNSAKLIKSNEFSFVDDEFLFNFSKYVICKNLIQFTEMLKDEIEVRFIQTDITMSTESIENDIPNLKDLTVADKGRKISTALKEGKRNGSAKSYVSTSKRNAAKPAKQKRKINVDELYEITRTSVISASVKIDCQTILEGGFNVIQDCVFVPVSLTKSETKPEPENISPEKTKKRVGKTHLKSNTKKDKVETIPEEVENDLDASLEHNEPPSLQFYLNVIQWKSAKEALDWVSKFGSKILEK